jgi:predicted phosphodiesterase
MRIQYFSDIHLEFGPFEAPATDADVVVAAGDIGVGVDGINWLKQIGKPVIYVAGNHEYYLGQYQQIQRALATAAAGSSIHLLENSEVVIDGVRFVGATLWTDFDEGNPLMMREAQLGMNDYLHIGYGDGRLQPVHILQANAGSRAWLERALATGFGGKTVVVTHHAPSFRSWKNEPDSLFKHAYCSDLDRLLDKERVDLWIHGHIHYVSDYRQNGVRVLCNPRGYHGYQTVKGFDAAKTVEV